MKWREECAHEMEGSVHRKWKVEGAQEVRPVSLCAGRVQHFQRLHASQTQREQLQGQSVGASPQLLSSPLGSPSPHSLFWRPSGTS